MYQDYENDYQPVIDVDEVEPVVEEVVEETTEVVDSELLGRVNYAKLNIRTSPSTTAKVEKVVSKDDLVTILDEEDSWYHVSLEDGTTGYCMREYIDVV